MQEMWADSWGINYKNYATVRHGNAQSCWKARVHILSERTKLANILTAKGTQDTVAGLQKCFSGLSHVNKVVFCKLQEAAYENQLEKTYIQRSDSVSKQVSKRFPANPLEPQNHWVFFFSFCSKGYMKCQYFTQQSWNSAWLYRCTRIPTQPVELFVF